MRNEVASEAGESDVRLAVTSLVALLQPSLVALLFAPPTTNALLPVASLSPLLPLRTLSTRQ